MQYFTAMVLLTAGVTANTELQWSEDYGQAKAAARAENRPLLVIMEDTASKLTEFNDEKLASQKDQISGQEYPVP